MKILAVEVDEGFCDGVGYCEKICPDVFMVDPQRRKAVVVGEFRGSRELAERVQLAENSCPMRAIVVTTEEASDIG